ncbi:acyl-CoA Delta-9 desaturase-like [Chrysoperla carnea]|uniref:acyl-CoA Delta-9 desaturase-like n=1 Tax=Chrysoperla carnea TaxID=189513 RepID=UPI001D060D79|nr:acyl-CoA Delta-9 desaturase-like [Chrysoperla carnea]
MEHQTQIHNKNESYFKKLFNFKTELIWLNIVSIIGFHFFAVYTLYLYDWLNFPNSVYTVLWAVVTGGIAGFGVTAGAHRLWSHRSYKAKLPLRIILMLCYAMAGQNRLYDWVRDHRVHHKFSETDADPHNANRGFFFAHVGWLMMRKHPDVLQKGRLIDMSDILEDPVVQFFERYFYFIKFTMCFIIPSAIPMYFWNETWFYAICSQSVIRYVSSLNFTWLVNSAAHIWGNKPYDRRIGPVENMSVALVAMGEGWHNYHHVFPWDYKAAELGNYRVNITTFWLDLFAKIGWAYDLKAPSKELIQKVIEKSGDGTHSVFGEKEISENEDKWRKQKQN